MFWEKRSECNAPGVVECLFSSAQIESDRCNDDAVSKIEPFIRKFQSFSSTEFLGGNVAFCDAPTDSQQTEDCDKKKKEKTSVIIDNL